MHLKLTLAIIVLSGFTLLSCHNPGAKSSPIQNDPQTAFVIKNNAVFECDLINQKNCKEFINFSNLGSQNKFIALSKINKSSFSIIDKIAKTIYICEIKNKSCKKLNNLNLLNNASYNNITATKSHLYFTSSISGYVVNKCDLNGENCKQHLTDKSRKPYTNGMGYIISANDDFLFIFSDVSNSEIIKCSNEGTNCDYVFKDFLTKNVEYVTTSEHYVFIISNDEVNKNYTLHRCHILNNMCQKLNIADLKLGTDFVSAYYTHSSLYLFSTISLDKFTKQKENKIYKCDYLGENCKPHSFNFGVPIDFRSGIEFY